MAAVRTTAFRWAASAGHLLAIAAWLGCGSSPAGAADEYQALLDQGVAAETSFETARALELFLAAEALNSQDVFVLRKISRQYSDLVEDAVPAAEKRRQAELSLAYALRAEALAPQDPTTVVTVAIAQAKLAQHGEVRQRVEAARAVRARAEHALALAPENAWPHHVLGCWHYEVSTANAPTRWAARILFGGLPPATLAEAIQHLQRAAELEPDVLLHRVELGFALSAAGRHEDARQEWQRALALPIRQKLDPSAQQRAREALRASK